MSIPYKSLVNRHFAHEFPTLQTCSSRLLRRRSELLILVIQSFPKQTHLIHQPSLKEVWILPLLAKRCKGKNALLQPANPAPRLLDRVESLLIENEYLTIAQRCASCRRRTSLLPLLQVSIALAKKEKYIH
ncbi:hypothetical protein O6H91_02G067000 [Diphasiastrum complanatum]|uniref:Uncharacterized protein n=1 Tax=Diphasiastrum complanatum TaxID=34168 RepID=A0ACC2EGN4_DIPCM|nr:hypothetical protein O6H91_02G067000 [Diphasiastrum complanatum]